MTLATLASASGSATSGSPAPVTQAAIASTIPTTRHTMDAFRYASHCRAYFTPKGVPNTRLRATAGSFSPPTTGRQPKHHPVSAVLQTRTPSRGAGEPGHPQPAFGGTPERGAAAARTTRVEPTGRAI